MAPKSMDDRLFMVYYWKTTLWPTLDQKFGGLNTPNRVANRRHLFKPWSPMSMLLLWSVVTAHYSVVSIEILWSQLNQACLQKI